MARLFELTTPLGEEVLLFRSLQGHEELGRVSQFELSALSTRNDISPADLLGKKITVTVELRNDDGYRYFNGYVARFAQTATVGRYYEYRLTVRPWLWFLTRTADCRIFQDKTAREIIVEVFQDARHQSLPDYEDRCTGKYAKREYCVQYRETDFDFVSRLMEEEGIYYYFEHRNDRHVLILADSAAGHQPLEHKPAIPFYPPGTPSRVDEEYIDAWTFDQSIQPGVVTLDDYDFTKPKAELVVKARALEKHDYAAYEIFDYPGEYRETDEGEHYAQARVDELHTQFERARAAGNVREIAVGRLFTLTNFPRQDQDREYLIISADWALLDNPYETMAAQPASYHCTFGALPSRQQFRPERITPRPIMRGLQTAVVMGPPGEEIHTDKYGRVKVRFHWDRYGANGPDTSCWIRVSTIWAGNRRGMIHIPLVGDEVIVGFLEGDPDRPLIVGSVYNDAAMPPWTLPDNKTSSGYKGRTGSNQLEINDKAGAEWVHINAHKNMNIDVLGDKMYTAIPNGEYELNVKGLVWIRSLEKIKLEVGGSTIEMTPAEITIKSPMVKINC